jgi:putative Ca2+/H+ antiporter (TMEM165/GDT1 family)
MVAVVRRGSSSEATGLFVGVLWGMLPTAVLIVSVVVMLENGLPLAVSMFPGSAVWVIFTLVARKGGLFGGL